MSLSKNFKYTTNIVNSISEIAAIQGEISNLTLDIADHLRISRHAQAESSHFSTRIEGNPLTLKQVTTVLDSKINKKKTTRNLKEIINYAKTRQFILDQKIFLNEKNLLYSHDLLFSQIIIKSMRGRYRNQQNSIRNANNGNLIYMPPEWNDVPILIKSLFKICSLHNFSISEAIIYSGIFHFHFESIHPFLDGNGRLGRLWSINILKSNGLSFVEYSAIEKYHEQNRSTYYELLHLLQGNIFYNISPQLDLTPWLEYWVSGLEFSAKESKNQLIQLPRITEDFLTEKRILLAYNLFKKHKKLSAEQYQQLTLLGRTQAVADLNQLIKKKLIKKSGGGRSTVYLLIEKKHT